MASQEEKIEQKHVVIKKELDYSKKVGSSGIYKYRRIREEDGSESFNMGNNTSVTKKFKLPATDVINLAKSKLRYSITIPAAGAGVFNKVRIDYPQIRTMRMIVEDQTLVYIDKFPSYWKIIKDHVNRELYGPAGYGATLAAAKLRGVCNFRNKCGGPLSFSVGESTAAIVAAADGKSVPNFDIQLNANNSFVSMQALSPYPGKPKNDGSLDTDYFNIENAEQVLVSGGDNAAVCLHCSLNFHDLVHTVLAMDRSMYFGQGAELEIEWLPATKFVFTDTEVNTINTAPAVTAVTPVISEMNLWLAVEQKNNNILGLKSKLMNSSLNLTIPYVVCKESSLGNDESASASFAIRPNHGSNLLRCYTAEKVTADSKNLLTNFYNIGGDKTTSFYHSVNTDKYEPHDIKPQNFDEYNLQEFLNEDSLVQKKGAKAYYANCPSYVLDWSSCNKLVDCRMCDLEISGIDILKRKEVILTRDVEKSGTATTCVFVAITQKTLVVSLNGVLVT